MTIQLLVSVMEIWQGEKTEDHAYQTSQKLGILELVEKGLVH